MIEQLKAAMLKSKGLPVGFIVGKIVSFNKPIFSKHYSYYVIVAHTQFTVTLEWKEIWSEGFTDKRFGVGGTFEKRELKHIVDWTDMVNKVVSLKIWGRRWDN